MKTTTFVRYRSPSRERSVDVSLSDFDLDEIRKEYEHRRNVGPQSELANDGNGIDKTVTINVADLRRLRALLLCRQEAAAIEAMRDMIRDALGTAL